MNIGPQLLLIVPDAAVGVLHTMAPDHWAPIALFAHQRGWSKAETARAGLQAGIGHVPSTLLIVSVVGLARKWIKAWPCRGPGASGVQSVRSSN